MGIVFCDGGKQKLLNYLIGQSGSSLSPVKYHLYTNNVLPNHADTLATYTEAAFTGYQAGLVTTWNPSTIDGTFHASTNAGTVSYFNNGTGGVQVYGYYVTDSGSTFLIFAEQFSGAPLTIGAGQQLQVIPAVTLTTGS
jgi:hypothetical protein